MKFNIKMYADFQCPYCYIGKSIFNSIKDEYDTELTFKSFEIHSDAPQEGIPVGQYFGTDLDLNENIKAYGKKYGIEMAHLTTVVNSNNALQVAEYAKEIGKSEEYNSKMYEAMFTETLNIGQLPVLKEIAASVGITGEEVDKVLSDEKYKQIIVDNQHYCTQAGISSVPTFIINDKVKITGAQPPEVFKEVFEKFEKGNF
jgi:predicted DsbA family dithiol-disulfide isomerase